MEFLDILIELEEEKINCTDPNSLVTKNGCKCRLATKDVGFGCRYFKAGKPFFAKSLISSSMNLSCEKFGPKFWY